MKMWHGTVHQMVNGYRTLWNAYRPHRGRWKTTRSGVVERRSRNCSPGPLSFEGKEMRGMYRQSDGHNFANEGMEMADCRPSKRPTNYRSSEVRDGLESHFGLPEAPGDDTIVPQPRDAHAPRIPAIAGKENVSYRKAVANNNTPLTGVDRLRAPESAPINPSPPLRWPPAAREEEAPRVTPNNVGEFTAIGASATARVNEGAKRASERERVVQLDAAVDAHGGVSTIPRRADARHGGRNRANDDDYRRDRRDARAARYMPPNEINDSLAHDERTVLMLVFVRMIANDHCRCAKARAPGPTVMIVEDELMLVFVRMIANDHCRCAKARAPGPTVMIVEDEQWLVQRLTVRIGYEGVGVIRRGNSHRKLEEIVH
ncbi:hypothetical protein PLICRDRAFT_174069 [Plicaturopsis crispa FD-325 SS-3]|nr:hypothetical protein PLICRDRAFT_174069 [Plicaturopsis crispa FD-325 SS-3]